MRGASIGIKSCEELPFGSKVERSIHLDQKMRGALMNKGMKGHEEDGKTTRWGRADLKMDGAIVTINKNETRDWHMASL